MFYGFEDDELYEDDTALKALEDLSEHLRKLTNAYQCTMNSLESIISKINELDFQFSDEDDYKNFISEIKRTLETLITIQTEIQLTN